MIFFLNRGLVLERETAKAFAKYFEALGLQERYKNFNVRVTNSHPFARAFISANASAEAASLFPAAVVTTESDQKPAQLASLAEPLFFNLGLAELEGGEGGKSAAEKRYDITAATAARMREAAARAGGVLPCRGWRARRQDTIAIEIWSENPQLNNELYEAARLFACGFLRDYLPVIYGAHFDGDKNALAVFDGSVKGQRQAGFNFDFGVALYGSRLTFEADYIIEQAVADTEQDGSGTDFLPEAADRAYTAG